jgi:Bax protein
MAASTIPKPNQTLTLRECIGDALVLLAAVALLTGFFMLPSTDYRPLPDFSSMDVATKKRQFFAYLSPIVARVNDQIRADRERLDRIAARLEAGKSLSWFDRRWVAELAARLEVPYAEQDIDQTMTALQRRVGVVPESLVLAQAAKESGWGTSRFAVEGNNLFGQRCYRPDCGLVPQQRADGARFAVARFDNVAESVESYVRNLNTHPTYRSFRDLRQIVKRRGDPLTGLALLDGLADYSERGEAYLAELRALIRQNGLE